MPPPDEQPTKDTPAVTFEAASPDFSHLSTLVVGSNMETRMGLPEGYDERVATYIPEIRYDKIMEAFGGHCEHVEGPENIHAALERAYQASREGKAACVNVISEPAETMVTRSNRASALMGY